MLYGNAIDLNRMLLTAPAEPGAETTVHQYLQGVLHTQETLTRNAIERQREVVAARLAKAPPNPTMFEVGSYVLVKPRGVKDHVKFDVSWWGPYVVVGRDHESYDCQDLNTHKVHQFSADRLKVYRHDIQVPAKQVALWGTREYEVENIVSHKAAATAAKYKFRVRWAGFGPQDDTELPYKDVKELACFRRYIRDHDLPANLFPRNKLPLLD